MSDLSYNISANKRSGGLLKTLFSKHKVSITSSEEENLQGFFEEIENAKKNLEKIRGLFDSTNDPDLIEYAIYEEYALKLRLSYFIKKAKEKDIKSVIYRAF